jgi:hypothetical protein
MGGRGFALGKGNTARAFNFAEPQGAVGPRPREHHANGPALLLNSEGSKEVIYRQMQARQLIALCHMQQAFSNR